MMPPPTVELDENFVVNFYRSARIERKREAYIKVMWKLPEWTVVAAAPEYSIY